jgi:hypothetical protein
MSRSFYLCIELPSTFVADVGSHDSRQILRVRADEALPIWIDGTSRPRLRRAARFGDGHTGPADTDTWQTYREELENLGKDPTTARRPSRNQWLGVSEDPERTVALYARY